jgi:RND superfamily putative drug exporter
MDATIVRRVLVPATMELLGDANWWMPGRLNKILPNAHIGGDAAMQTKLTSLLASEEVAPAVGG